MLWVPARDAPKDQNNHVQICASYEQGTRTNLHKFAPLRARRPSGGPTLGKSKGGLTTGGLSPKFSEKIGGNSFLRNRAFSGQIGTFSGPIGAFSGPIGTISSAPHSHGGKAEIAPKGPFLAQLAPFGPSPPLLSPPLDFPDYRRPCGVHIRALGFGAR